MLSQSQIDDISSNYDIVQLTNQYRREGMPATDFLNDALYEAGQQKMNPGTSVLVGMIADLIIAKAEAWNDKHKPKTKGGWIRSIGIKIAALVASIKWRR